MLDWVEKNGLVYNYGKQTQLYTVAASANKKKKGEQTSQNKTSAFLTFNNTSNGSCFGMRNTLMKRCIQFLQAFRALSFYLCLLKLLLRKKFSRSGTTISPVFVDKAPVLGCVSICWCQISVLREAAAALGLGRSSGSMCWLKNALHRISCRNWQECACKEKHGSELTRIQCLTKIFIPLELFQLLSLSSHSLQCILVSFCVIDQHSALLWIRRKIMDHK